MKKYNKTISLPSAIITALLSLAFSAQAHSRGCSPMPALDEVLELDQGSQHALLIDAPVTRLAIGDPQIADLKLTGRDSILLTGMGAGTTSLNIWTRCASAPLQSQVLVKGTATQAISPAQPQIDAAVPSQVQTDIRFVEVNRTKLKDVGISLFGKRGSFLFGAPGNTTGSVGLGGLVPGGNNTPVPLQSDGFNIAWGGGTKEVLGVLNALENSNFAYTLATPSLVSLNGKSASFLAGGEFPVPVPSADGSSISIEYKEFGVRLSLTPTVVDGSRILLKVAPEVSELNFNTGVSIAGTTVPSLNVRRTDTSVALASGESFVISGLMSASNYTDVDKLPGLGDLPVLGGFFRSSRIAREEKELLMIVTPHLVQPLAADAQLPELPGEQYRNYDPNAFELLFLENGDFDMQSGLSR
ncbi:type II and III secretion system protein family protein [Oceanimonas baumannii]|uniref:type II and III secretion system protein family protein n=1 Tax=Oceanimonas baumannii TaxID=129578 RepID=UPI001D18FE9A|nr:type II and III secretion system protein family protein [Oceanimonas baumannii]MCC4264658.1 type II and III secretion system protein family protein [Oceanimonas baumannii]